MSGGKQINCAYCDKEKLSKNEIGLNKKLIHRQIERMMCLTCLAAFFEMTEEKLKEMIDRLKQQGCSLFG
jgi:transcription elongation factor Elf1